MLIIYTSGTGQFNNVKKYIDANKSGFDILDRNISCDPCLILDIRTTSTTIKCSASGMATTGNVTLLFDMEA